MGGCVCNTLTLVVDALSSQDLSSLSSVVAEDPLPASDCSVLRLHVCPFSSRCMRERESGAGEKPRMEQMTSTRIRETSNGNDVMQGNGAKQNQKKSVRLCRVSFRFEEDTQYRARVSQFGSALTISVHA
jgi:hypothetical protein